MAVVEKKDIVPNNFSGNDGDQTQQGDEISLFVRPVLKWQNLG